MESILPFTFGCGLKKDVELKQNDSLLEYSFSENTEWDCVQLELDGHVFCHTHHLQ